uniref:Uncharacterized protein n=1 Tax=Opuntia streptacantha TaxID=393608 RepID=A0A7C9F130_OPUST
MRVFWCCLQVPSNCQEQTQQYGHQDQCFRGLFHTQHGDCSLHCCSRGNPKASFEGPQSEITQPAEGCLPHPLTAGLAMMTRWCDSRSCYWWSSEPPQGAHPWKFPKRWEPNSTVFYSTLNLHPNPFQGPPIILRGRQ